MRHGGDAWALGLSPYEHHPARLVLYLTILMTDQPSDLTSKKAVVQVMARLSRGEARRLAYELLSVTEDIPDGD